MEVKVSSEAEKNGTFRLEIHKKEEDDRVVALAGNPNVGKSTIFNQLTGMHQHTGNWPGKTVTNAQGYCTSKEQGYVLVDIPGSYSLMAHSAEEEVARDYICFEHPDGVIVVCDATCLERNLNLVLQVREVTANVMVCVNLMDEAKKKKIHIDLKRLEQELGVPVIGTTARKKNGLEKILQVMEKKLQKRDGEYLRVKYSENVEEAIDILVPYIGDVFGAQINNRWMAVKLLEGNDSFTHSLERYFDEGILDDDKIKQGLELVEKYLYEKGISREQIQDDIVAAFVAEAEKISQKAVAFQKRDYDKSDRRLDRIFTSKATGFPIMLALLLLLFWITITGANYPSELLSTVLFGFEDSLLKFFGWIGAPVLLTEMLVYGVYRVLAWVVSVMLPPMAIFFPLFTLLEDFGYLPRVAYNLDKCFKKCGACGKQALTMCMGFGCNAAGVIGCRIIDSPRESLIAIITNSFVPCNGRFPILITIITMYFVGTAGGFAQSLLSAVLLTLVIVFGVLMTFAASKILSRTILKGVPSSFALEMPPYRNPQIGKVLIRSIFDRTLFVLGRAVVVAAPAGLVIWVMANVTIGDMTILNRCSEFLDPFGRLIGMDGVILLAFILGWPANEIVIPIMIMTYLAQGSLVEMDNLNVLKQLLTENGWTWITAVSTMLFALLHWPCSTTCMTIKKETGSKKWTLIAFFAPAAAGTIVCFIFSNIARMFW